MKHKDIIILLASAFLLVIAWVTFNIYHNFVSSTTQEALKKETIPITPIFDEKAINKIKERNRIVPFFGSNNQTATKSPNPSLPEALPTSTKTPKASESSTEVASPEGEITP